MTNMKDLITFIYKNRKSSIHTVGKIHVIYRYIKMIRSPTKFTTSGQRYHHFGPSYSINNDTACEDTRVPKDVTHDLMIILRVDQTNQSI